MANVTFVNDPEKKMYEFDLKGSTVERETEDFNPWDGIKFIKDHQNLVRKNFRR